jgi:chemotaxis signal transduction protein
MTAPESSARPPLRACVFTLAGEQLAADVGHAREVVVLPERTTVPRAPAHVLGVANLRGNIVPIVDIGHLLGLPPRPVSEGLRTLVLEDAGIQVAIPTDDVLGLETFDDVLAADEASSNPCPDLAVGRLKRGDGTVATLLDVARLIATIGGSPGDPMPDRGRGTSP